MSQKNQVLIDNGWKNYHTCKECKGMMAYYSHEKYPGIIVRIRIERNTAVIIEKNCIIAGPFYAYLMQKQLDEHLPKQSDDSR